jgi:hypothetical protein
MRRGGNYEALIRPMTLEQVFPSLRNAPGGAIIALADNLLDFSGPSQALSADLTDDLTDTLIRQIRTVDPDYRFDSVGFPQTFEGQMNQLNNLRFELAAALLRNKGDSRAMQVETLRFMQERTDKAYERGVELLKAGKLPIRLSKQEALGNYIDWQVRLALRMRYNQYGLESAREGPVRVNRRENDSSGSELTYRRPDARVGRVAFDVTLALKTGKTAQVRGFFGTDFKPQQVVIIRPSRIGPDHTYVIKAPENGR